MTQERRWRKGQHVIKPKYALKRLFIIGAEGEKQGKYNEHTQPFAPMHARTVALLMGSDR